MMYNILTVLAACTSLTYANKLASRQSCSPDFRICAPAGATSNSLGPIGSSWAELYMSIVNVVGDYAIGADAPTTTTVDPNGPARREQAFCCSNVARCLVVDEYNIAMCWDKFTTNVYFPDGTYGSVASALFNTSDGDKIDLNYGSYTLRNGTKGNIYDGDTMSSMRPDTATISVPTPWTSSGVGSAIPATELGTTASLSTGTTVIPATTEAPSTSDSITLIATMTNCGNCPPWNTTIPGPTQPGTSRAASTSVFTTGIIVPTMTGSMAHRTNLDLANAVAAVALGFIAYYF